ncbi:hypothetical protein MYP_385 [Sporocytophaga myxococcoides]|uniref:Uncharacterized protein n=1 Tax=Sporocytophaga myxococcoides TaxID=153721 RepID=A0A098L9S6_9BACT|nr:hypothetical protein [Sporocytophaga myxococcoides]GAL83159.1 hypothetical protein MYP_385 [Sporocytophaga myxococcoides]
MEKIAKGIPDIKDWGIDADPENDPTYPMKPNRTDEEQNGYTWERSVQQAETVEILKSTERPNLSAVFGTSVPPKGLSGAIRRYAYKNNEGQFSHWLPLLIADRVDVVEGIIDDLKKGKVPNIYAEKGFNVMWKYNRKAAIGLIAANIAAVSAIGLFLFRGRIFNEGKSVKKALESYNM